MSECNAKIYYSAELKVDSDGLTVSTDGTSASGKRSPFTLTAISDLRYFDPPNSTPSWDTSAVKPQLQDRSGRLHGSEEMEFVKEEEMDVKMEDASWFGCKD
jgi:hypothetical protein